jgi:hypothetical protein
LSQCHARLQGAAGDADKAVAERRGRQRRIAAGAKFGILAGAGHHFQHVRARLRRQDHGRKETAALHRGLANLLEQLLPRVDPQDRLVRSA